MLLNFVYSLQWEVQLLLIPLNMSKLFWGAIYVENVVQIYMDSP